MSASFFLKLFPPPEFLLMDHAGLEISDDAIRCLSYKESLLGRSGKRRIKHFMSVDLPKGLLIGGDTVHMDMLREELLKFKEKSGISYVKVSIPEEKAYLFQTEVPALAADSIYQNIESKLEENVPLLAKDAVFNFDLFPSNILRASVSVVPKTYIEKMLDLLHSVGLKPLAFEIVPRSLARVLVPANENKTAMIVHIMDQKIGVYIVSSGIVDFASTVSKDAIDSSDIPRATVEDTIAKEITRIYGYWVSRPDTTTIHDILLVGNGAQSYEAGVRNAITSLALNVIVPDVWKNIFKHTDDLPPISQKDSLAYATVVGLALT
ncbi:MAG: hypothetical protein WCO48_03470 [Candidatus Taylorbacteria bacterium]